MNKRQMLAIALGAVVLVAIYALFVGVPVTVADWEVTNEVEEDVALGGYSYQFVELGNLGMNQRVEIEVVADNYIMTAFMTGKAKWQYISNAIYDNLTMYNMYGPTRQIFTSFHIPEDTSWYLWIGSLSPFINNVDIKYRIYEQVSVPGLINVGVFIFYFVLFVSSVAGGLFIGFAASKYKGRRKRTIFE